MEYYDQFDYTKYRKAVWDGVYDKFLERMLALGNSKETAEENAMMMTSITILNFKHAIEGDYWRFIEDCKNIYQGYSDMAYPWVLENEIEEMYAMGVIMIALNEEIKRDKENKEDKNGNK